MHHDASGNLCQARGHIMSPTRGTQGETTWSSCSADVVYDLRFYFILSFYINKIKVYRITVGPIAYMINLQVSQTHKMPGFMKDILDKFSPPSNNVKFY